MRYSNLTYNVWLQKPKNVKNTDECSAMRSKYSQGNGSTGSIIKQNCSKDEATTVCELVANKEPVWQTTAKEYNPNENFVPNIRLKYSNGTDSHFFTGVYYILQSKYKNSTFSNSILGNVSNLSCYF